MDVGVTLAGPVGVGTAGRPTETGALANLSGQAPSERSGASSGSKSRFVSFTFLGIGLPDSNDDTYASPGCPADNRHCRCWPAGFQWIPPQHRRMRTLTRPRRSEQRPLSKPETVVRYAQ